MIPWTNWYGLKAAAIEVGDFVRQKGTERPRMKVYAIADGKAFCSWWVSEMRRVEEWLPVDQSEPWAEEDLT